MESDQSPQLKGVVIITLPPPDDPSLGKTITAFTLSETRQLPIQQIYQSYEQTYHDQLPIQPPQNPQLSFSFRNLFGIQRAFWGLLSMSLFALCLYGSVFTDTIEKLRNPKDEHEFQSFLLPLYPKLGESLNGDVELKLGRFMDIDKENFVGPNNDGLMRPKKINKLVSSRAAFDSSTVLPVTGNVYPDGLYFTYILIGSPPRPYYLDMDTGSDLTWIQCDAPCSSCAKGKHALYKPTKGNIVSPKDSLCMEVQRNGKTGSCETCQQCDYEIEYADHSSSMGVLAKDELRLKVANGSLTKLNVVFGCGYDQQGILLNALSKTDGILGLSRAKVSLPSQLASQGIIKNVVGHCINPDASASGYMFLGDDFVPQWGMKWVPMLNSPSIDFYQTEIVKMNYGSSMLSLGRWGSRVGQVIFDSGSSYTYFTKDAYSDLVASLKEISVVGLVEDASDPTLPLCWRAKSPIRSLLDVKQFFRTLTLQFESKWRILYTKLQIPPEGYLIVSDKGNVCLGILEGSNLHDGSTFILGDISLRGQLVVYDNINQKIGWLQSDCVEPQIFKNLPVFEG